MIEIWGNRCDVVNRRDPGTVSPHPAPITSHRNRFAIVKPVQPSMGHPYRRHPPCRRPRGQLPSSLSPCNLHNPNRGEAANGNRAKWRIMGVRTTWQVSIKSLQDAGTGACRYPSCKLHPARPGRLAAGLRDLTMWRLLPLDLRTVCSGGDLNHDSGPGRGGEWSIHMRSGFTSEPGCDRTRRDASGACSPRAAAWK